MQKEWIFWAKKMLKKNRFILKQEQIFLTQGNLTLFKKVLVFFELTIFTLESTIFIFCVDIELAMFKQRLADIVIYLPTLL